MLAWRPGEKLREVLLGDGEEGSALGRHQPFVGAAGERVEPRRVEDGATVDSDAVILAPGSTPRTLPVDGVDRVRRGAPRLLEALDRRHGAEDRLTELCATALSLHRRFAIAFLAWALDRQVPEWFSVVNERTNAPLRVIILAILLGAVFFALTFPPINFTLAATTFFGILLAGLTWIMPGLNAILIPFRRPDLFQLTNNTGRFLGLPRLVWSGILWLIFIVPVYAAAFVYPVVKGIQQLGGTYLSLSTANTSGIGWALVFIAVGIVIYFTMRLVNASRGINVKMIYQELPPD